ncbi:MAG: TRL domain-containing protein [Flavobacteriales bacterium]
MKKYKNILFSLGVLVILTSFSSCTVTTTYPVMVTENSMSGTAKGEASVKKFLGIGWGNRGAAKAARNGNIKKISAVDLKITNAPFVTTYTTVVTGTKAE